MKVYLANFSLIIKKITSFLFSGLITPYDCEEILKINRS